MKLTQYVYEMVLHSLNVSDGDMIVVGLVEVVEVVELLEETQPFVDVNTMFLIVHEIEVVLQNMISDIVLVHEEYVVDVDEDE